MNHCWNKHPLDPGFAYKCDVSSCTSKLTNIQSLRRHLKSKHLWFHEKYLQIYGRVENEDVDLDENSENENVISMQLDESGVSSGENNESDCEKVSFSDFDRERLAANFLLELKEIYGTNTQASCFISDKVMHILQLENKIRYSMFTKSIRQNNPDIILDHESELILTCESAFAKAFKKFSGKKNLNEFVKNQEYFIEPKQISLVFDPTTQREDTIQYVPIYSTLNAVLRHEDVLAHNYAETSQNGVIKTFRDSLAFKSNKFLNSREHVLEICLYHDDFSIVKPLGNKTHKHISVLFCFRKFSTKIQVQT